ncbi:MAG: SAM-dependent methyltransferase, partial [Xanthobacteraceae bacterium]
MGSLQVTTAAGRTYTFGDGGGPPVAIRFTSASAQRSILLDPELKLGEAYMDGTLVVERGSIADVLAILFRQERTPMPRWAWPPHLVRHLLRHLQQFNPRTRARRNVAHHY